MIIVFLLIAAFVLRLTAGIANADDSSKIVRVGYVTMENYQEGKEGERKKGYGYEYLQKIAQNTGWKYEYVYGSFSEVFSKLKNGEIDLMGNISYQEEREEYIYYSDLPQGKESYFIYTNSDNEKIDFSDLSSLKNCSIGVTENSYQEDLFYDWLKKNGHTCDVVLYPGSNQVTAALQAHEIDGMVLTDMAAISGFVPVTSIGFGDFYFGVAKSRPDLLDELNRAMYDIQSRNLHYNELLYAKYYDSSISNTTLSSEEKEWLSAHNNTIRIGYLNGNSPYSDTNESGELTGILTVLVDTFSRDYGINVVVKPYEDMYAIHDAFNNGELDLFGPLYNDYWLAESYGILHTDAFATTSLMLLISKDADIQQEIKKVGYATNIIEQYGAILLLYPDAEYVAYNTGEECLEAIKSGKVDCSVISTATMNAYRRYSAFDSITFTELPVEAGICMGAAKSDTALLNLANRIIFISEDALRGAALTEGSYIKQEFSYRAFLKEHTVEITVFLVGVILFLIISFVFYWKISAKIIKTEKKNAELSSRAFRDEMTQVGNRAYYVVNETRLQSQIDKGENKPFALLEVDVNELKTVNDSYGHEMGDILIKSACQSICRVFSHSPVFRMGGDEFVVLLEGQDYENREHLIELLKAECRAPSSKEEIGMGAFSFAVGMAEYDSETDKTVKDILERADKRMYDCKSRMKNKSENG
ncbi:MAG: diguanylate cyclase domain-containing protein [Oscillospiraceae bacterium]